MRVTRTDGRRSAAEDAYDAAHTAKGQVVQSEQWGWIKRYGPDCGLPLSRRPAPDLIPSAAPCVSRRWKVEFGNFAPRFPR